MLRYTNNDKSNTYPLDITIYRSIHLVRDNTDMHKQTNQSHHTYKQKIHFKRILTVSGTKS